MKLYPILPIKNNKWRNWNHTVLKEINSKIYSLFQYINYFNPDFYEYILEPINGHIDIADLPLHGYYKVSNIGLIDDTTGKTLDPGSLIVSYARAEGQLDNHDAQVRRNSNFYTIQPFGWASYYTMNFTNRELITSYERYAQETYGLIYTFVFDTANKRYFIRKNIMQNLLNSIQWTSKALHLAASNGSIKNKENWYIINQDNNSTFCSLWANDKNPLMHGFYYIVDEWNCEEIVFDNTWETNSKLADTNIAIYTITRKDSSTWPCLSLSPTLSSVLQLEVW